MAVNEEGNRSVEDVVYRISTLDEWEALQKNGTTFGRELDETTGCIHLSKLDQVQPVLQRFYQDFKNDLYLLQIDAKKLGDGLIYEAVDSDEFPHFYGPNRSFGPLPLSAVIKGEKMIQSDGKYTCNLLN